jgi:hypothetical protein
MLLIDRIFKKNLQAWEILDFSIVCTKNYKMGKKRNFHDYKTQKS